MMIDLGDVYVRHDYVVMVAYPEDEGQISQIRSVITLEDGSKIFSELDVDAVLGRIAVDSPSMVSR